jgi:Ca2+-binding EF-hand superfamily protein
MESLKASFEKELLKKL